MNNNFGKRLTSARKMRGLSLQELADKLDLPLSKQSLSKYENGLSLPNSDIIISLSKALNQPVDYLFADITYPIELRNVDYRRHKSKLSKVHQSAIEEIIKSQLERYIELENILGVSNNEEYFQYDNPIGSINDAEVAAIQLRKVWNLGYDPIPDVVEMLEDKGYKVIEIEATEGFDGIKADAADKKVIVINKNQKNIVRKRLTLLHELAHHSLTFSSKLTEKEAENLCHAFAGAVLYPGDMVKKELFQYRTKRIFFHEFVLIKERWGLSFPAIFNRILQQGLISHYVFKSLNIDYRKNYFHKNEPGNYLSKERPTQFERLIYIALSQDIITMNEAAYYSGISAWDFRLLMQKAI